MKLEECTETDKKKKMRQLEDGPPQEGKTGTK